MQIQLKQTEIIQALKLYISSQGINLGGKTVSVGFTAGRKDSGLSADIDITEEKTEKDATSGVTSTGFGYQNEIGTLNRTPMPAHIASLKSASEAVDRETAEVMAELDAEEEVVLPVKGASLFG
jgi:hypothetical protein